MRLGQKILLVGFGFSILFVWVSTLGLAFFLEPAYGLIPLWPSTLLFYPLSIAGVVYGKEFARAFSLGCLSMSCITLAINFGLGTMLMADTFDGEMEFFTGIFCMLVAKWLLVPQGGLLCMFIYWLNQPHTKSSTIEVHDHPLAPDVDETEEVEELLETSIRRPR